MLQPHACRVHAVVGMNSEWYCVRHHSLSSLLTEMKGFFCISSISTIKAKKRMRGRYLWKM